MSVDFLLLQINDAAFPIGSYTQSYGLETYIQRGLITDEYSAFKYIQQYISNSFLYTELLSASIAYDYARANNFDKLEQLDNILRATKIPSEIRDASEKLGRRFVKTVIKMDINISDEYAKYYKNGMKLNTNHCSAYGFLCGLMNLDKNEVLRLYLYQGASSLVTNCVKTIPLSQVVGQKLLSSCYNFLNDCINSLENLTIEDVGRSIPAFDIRCMQHEVLYSRLYMS